MSKECLKITKNGKLLKTKWIYDEKKDIGSYKTCDVTNFAPYHLFEICDLDTDIRLKDIFKLIKKHEDIFEIILGNWCKDFINEGLKKRKKKYTGKYDKDEIEYLELYWILEQQIFEDGEYFYGIEFPDFHGIGYKLKEEYMYHKKGERINWSVSLTPVNELMNIPVKLKRTADIYKDDYTIKKLNAQKKIEIKGMQFTLGHILYGILWELSFHGNPKNRKDFSKHLKEIAEKYNE